MEKSSTNTRLLIPSALNFATTQEPINPAEPVITIIAKFCEVKLIKNNESEILPQNCKIQKKLDLFATNFTDFHKKIKQLFDI